MKKWLMFLLMAGALKAQHFMPGDQNLFFMPTACTVPAGTTQLSDYEVVFLNVTTGLDSRTHAGVYSLFPITTEFVKSLTLEFKHRLFESDRFRGGLWATTTPHAPLHSFGAVLDVLDERRSFHLAVSHWTDFDDDQNWVFMAGARFQTGGLASVIVELTSMANLFDDEYTGIVSVGVRLQGQRIAWDLAAVRPLEDTDDVLFIPLVKAMVLF